MKEDRMMRTNVMNSWRVISYWVTTMVTALELLAGGVTDLIHGRTALVAGDPVALVLAHLGYPVYLLTILGVWKLLGAIALLAPRFPRLKEWAYAGSFFVYAGAVASGMVRGLDDPGTFIWLPPHLGRSHTCFVGASTAKPYLGRPLSRKAAHVGHRFRSLKPQ
jgi:uncharacterized membrane protein YphA (DoxX/SURF4 family)